MVVFLDKGFKFQPYFCNRCHDILMMSIILGSIAILNIHGVDYGCNINRINRSDTVSLLQNADLTEKKRNIKKMKEIVMPYIWGKTL